MAVRTGGGVFTLGNLRTMYPGTKKLKFLETYRELIGKLFSPTFKILLRIQRAHFEPKTRPLARVIPDFWSVSRPEKNRQKWPKTGFFGTRGQKNSKNDKIRVFLGLPAKKNRSQMPFFFAAFLCNNK